MLTEEAKKKAVGTVVMDLKAVVSVAGTRRKEGYQDLWLEDESGFLWARVNQKKNIPIVKGNALMIKRGTIEVDTAKGGKEEKRINVQDGDWEIPAVSAPEEEKSTKGVLEPMVHDILARYDIAATDALWPCRHKAKDGSVTLHWVIYHRYCEQIQAKAHIVIDDPEIIKSGEGDNNEVVLKITGRLGDIREWSFGEASKKNTVVPYVWAMAEKRGKDRVILKLAGFHGMVYSEFETNWSA